MMEEGIKLLKQAREHYANRELTKAERELTQLLREHRGFADVHNMLGVIYHEQSRFEAAVECFEKALEINPAYTEAALNLAVTYNELGRYGDAKRVYGQAMVRTRREPHQLDGYVKGKLANMHADLAGAYHGAGLNEEALREYREAIGLCPTFVDIRARLALVMRDMGQIDEAIAEYRDLLETNPNYLPGRLHLGVTLYMANRLDEAIAEWRRALQIDPQCKSARSYLKMLGEETPEASADAPAGTGNTTGESGAGD